MDSSHPYIPSLTATLRHPHVSRGTRCSRPPLRTPLLVQRARRPPRSSKLRKPLRPPFPLPPPPRHHRRRRFLSRLLFSSVKHSKHTKKFNHRLPSGLVHQPSKPFPISTRSTHNPLNQDPIHHPNFNTLHSSRKPATTFGRQTFTSTTASTSNS